LTLAHEAALGAVLEQNQSQAERITFGSSWTTRPEARENGPLKQVLKELMIAMLVKQESANGTLEQICFGVPRVKTDQHFARLGYERLTHQGEVLSPFSLNSLAGESVVLVHCRQFSPEANAIAEKYADLWKERLLIQPELEIAEKKTKEAA
jgi:hypothetical protein